MKINRLLTAALITLATVLTSCVKESVWDRETGIDESKAAPEEFTYDEALSSKTSLAVYWDGKKAVDAGAQSFFVQLTDKDNMDKGNSWDSKLTKVVAFDKAHNVTFTKLKEKDRYFVRIRANYPGSVYSPWVYLSREDGSPALYEVGSGVVPVIPSVSLKAYVSEIEVTWTYCDVVKYEVEYKKKTDAAWSTPAEATGTSYTITGLSPETEYDVRVTSITANDARYTSEVATIKTAAESPFPKEIATADEWIAFITSEEFGLANNGADDKIILTADLDFAGKEVPTNITLLGLLDGNGKTIKNLQITAPLFKKVTGAQNLTFDATCALTATTGGKYGMLAEVTAGTVTNVTNNGTVTVNLAEAPLSTDALIAAGLVAEAEGDIVNCTNNGAVTINSPEGLEASLAGGICGYASTKVSGCTNSGKVSQNSTHYIVAAWVTYKGIDKVPQHTGGIVAMTKDGSLIENCTNTGNVVLNMTQIEKIGKSAGTNRIRIGGIAGAPRGDIKGCTNKGTVECYAMTSSRTSMKQASGNNYSISPGGITGGQMDWGGKPDSGAGIDTGMDVINCVNEGDVIVDADVDGNNSTVGGIVSHPGWESIENTNTIQNCVNKGNITVRGGGLFRIGGINGGIANIIGCENYGTLTLATNTKAGSSIGGISGFMNNGSKFENNKNYGDIVENSDVAHTVAGLIGGVGKTNGVTYGAGCAVKCSVTVVKSTTQAGMVLGYGSKDATIEPNFGTADSPIKVSGTFNGTPIDASNVVSTAKGSSSKGIMNVVYGE
jgi:hypothetical protein